ncbi:MAG: transposase [Anaerolineae bacterium]
MSTIPQNDELLKHLFELIEKQRPVFKQQRVYYRAIALLLAEIFVFARHTVTQLLMSLGMTDQDWSAWYRLFSQARFNYDKACAILFEETLCHLDQDGLYVVGGDATQTPRSSRKMEGAGWLRNMRTPPFMVGIHAAQRWFNGRWLMPQEGGYSRAMPLRWLPCFTEKSQPQAHAPCKEWEAAVLFLEWVRQQLIHCGQAMRQILMVGDGSYDTLKLWQHLPDGVILLARSAKNRVLYHLPDADAHKNCKYGERAPTPQAIWRERKGWRKQDIEVRGKVRHLQVKVRGAFRRKGATNTPLMLIVVRGKKRKGYRRDPLPFLVNAARNEQGDWDLPLPLETLLFWAWQRWELEVCHRELKSNFGLGNKQCHNPIAAVLNVQWSAWVYALLLLAGYRTWGLCRAPDVPTRWWRGSQRWSLNTLWRAYRAALWGQHDFHPIFTPTANDWGEKEVLLVALGNAIFASARS